MRKIKTVITLTFRTNEKAFNDPKFQEIIQDIKTGKAQREAMEAARKDDLEVFMSGTVWTDKGKHEVNKYDPFVDFMEKIQPGVGTQGYQDGFHDAIDIIKTYYLREM